MPIFDQGYQHWSGQLSGHTWRWLAITRHGVRTAMKSLLLRVALLLSWSPALVLAAMLCIWGMMERRSDLVKPLIGVFQFLGRRILTDPKIYRVEVWTILYDFFLRTEVSFAMILILMVGPNLISQDLRFNALPLYFSRPLRRIDYFLGKLGIITAFLCMVIVVPSIIAYILGLAFSLDITIIRDTYRILFSSILYGLIVSLSAGLLVLALSSLSRNSRYIALFWLGIWFVSLTLSGVMMGADRDQRQREFAVSIASQQQIDPDTPAGRRQMRRSMNWNGFLTAELEDSKTNWRPMIAYTENLKRISQKLLGTDAAWLSLSKLQPQENRDGFLVQGMGYQYPWYWSGIVLAGLFGISACTLNLRVRSLDRLK
jgi:ABC-2 type transport system permease protein